MSIGEVVVVGSLVESSDCLSIGEVVVVGSLVESSDCLRIGEVVVVGLFVESSDCLEKFFFCSVKQAKVKRSTMSRLYASEVSSKGVLLISPRTEA